MPAQRARRRRRALLQSCLSGVHATDHASCSVWRAHSSLWMTAGACAALDRCAPRIRTSTVRMGTAVRAQQGAARRRRAGADRVRRARGVLSGRRPRCQAGAAAAERPRRRGQNAVRAGGPIGRAGEQALLARGAGLVRGRAPAQPRRCVRPPTSTSPRYLVAASIGRSR